MLDGNLSSRWSTGTAMAPGQSIIVDMKAVQSLNQIVMDSASSNSDYARGYEVYVSNDGTNWGNAIASGTGSAAKITVDFAAQSARYIKVVQTGSTSSWWSIHEFRVFK
jgi:phage-related protein